MTTGVLFDIQYNAIYDGPGIRTCVFLKGCPLQCAWCHNPESQSDKKEIGWRSRTCIGCGNCVKTCPEQALSLTDGRISRDLNCCTVCGTCVETCTESAQEYIGYDMDADDLMPLLLADRPFYESSGGGVTFSGGEPTRQPEFLLEILARLKSERIHTAIETCGHFNTNLLPELISAVDLFLFDFKHHDPETHRRYTGVSNDTIMANLQQLISTAADKLIMRIPLIPEFNTDNHSIETMSAFLAKAGYTGRVDLLPYHGWAKGKYERTGRINDYRSFENVQEKDRQRIVDAFQLAGCQPIWGG